MQNFVLTVKGLDNPIQIEATSLQAAIDDATENWCDQEQIEEIASNENGLIEWAYWCDSLGVLITGDNR